MSNENKIALALQNGATKATMISADTIVLSDIFRKICKDNGCGNYGKCYMCPPDAGDIYELMDKVKTYKSGLLYQTISEIEDSFDIEGMQDAGVRHAQTSQQIEEKIKSAYQNEHLHLSCGGCHLCVKCAKQDNLPCRFPDKALCSLEAYGIDVYNTTKDTELKYINGQNTVTFFGLVLFMEDK